MTKKNVQTSKRPSVQTGHQPPRSGAAFGRLDVWTFGRFLDFARDPVSVAKRLLGQRLVRILDGRRLSGIIVETEAYLGEADRAAHTFNGRRTARNGSMYLPGGHAYIFFTYGMHYCFNVVCGQAGEGVAVLIRALEPVEGVETMYRNRFGRTKRPNVQTSKRPKTAPPARNAESNLDVWTFGLLDVSGRPLTSLCSGPAKLTQALALDRALDGADLRTSPVLFIERTRERCIASKHIAITPRVGVSYAGACADRPLRFFLKDSPHVSA